MSSFLSTVLTTAGRSEKPNLDEEITNIQNEITKLNDNVKGFMDDNYVEFTSKLTRNQHLDEKAEKLIQEIDSLQKRINDQIKIEVSGSTKELQNLSDALKNSNRSLQLSSELLSLDYCMNDVKKFQKEKRYVDAAKALVKMLNMLHKPESDLKKLEIYEAIEKEYFSLKEVFLSTTTCLLRKRICWSGLKDESKIMSLSIKNEIEDTKDLILALHHMNELSACLSDFSTTLIDLIIKPIVEYDCSVYVVDEKIFTVEILNRQKTSSCTCVLYNLQLLFKFLHQHFNIQTENDELFLRMLQPYLLNSLTDLLTTHCISQTVPTSSADFKKFDPVVESMEEFQTLLVQIGFIASDELFLSDYTKKVDELFFNRFMSDTLEQARNIMKQPLHISFTYDPKESLDFPDVTYDFSEFNDFKLNWTLSSDTFELPKCQISVSAKEILTLVRSILDEACQFPDNFASTLFYTCRTIFEMYAGLMPEYHWKFLETIPQHVALFHNSCMYLAHHLLTLAHEYRDRLPKSIDALNLTFTDQVTTLRNTAAENMLKHMLYQRHIIIDILKESGLAALAQTAELNPSTECELRQCIRQLELLRTVWIDVLPNKMYCRAIGCIANTMVEELITRVISVEDIPAHVATQLGIVFNIVISRIPSIFLDAKDVTVYVRMWEKFVQLVKVLGASMKEIEMGWRNCEGPLARVFTADEMKHLIRALFQNTDRRSELLAGIKGY